MLLEALDELVLEIETWPSLHIDRCDEPRLGLIGFQAGSIKRYFFARSLQHEIDGAHKRYREILTLPVKAMPLDQWPFDQEDRELHVYRTVLLCATKIKSPAGRRETAYWATFLGRLRAGASPLSMAVY